jgi:hypothetical protein
MAQAPGIFTCGGTDMLRKMEGQMSPRRAEAEKQLDDMRVFMKAHRRRIEQYIAFRRDIGRRHLKSGENRCDLKEAPQWYTRPASKCT